MPSSGARRCSPARLAVTTASVGGCTTSTRCNAPSRRSGAAGRRTFVDVSTFGDLPALAAWGRDAHAGAQAFVATATEGALARPIVMPWAGRFAQTNGEVTHPTLAQTVWQLSTHSAHHRGQVNARLRELGAEPPMVDVIVWIWRGQPTALWPRNVAEPRASDSPVDRD